MKKLLIGLLSISLLLGACTSLVPVGETEGPIVKPPAAPIIVPTQVLDGNLEEQASFSSSDPLGTTWTRLGQRLIIPNRKVTGLSFNLYKIGIVSGDIMFAIRDMDDNIVVSEIWGDAGDVPESYTWLEVTFDKPVIINGEVRLSCEWDGGTSNDCLQYSYFSGDRKPEECYTNYHYQWHDIGEAEEGNYKYTYGR